MTDLQICLAVDGAKEKNTRDAITMLEVLRDHLSGKNELTQDARQYWIDRTDIAVKGALQALKEADKAEVKSINARNNTEKEQANAAKKRASRLMQRLITQALNLTGLQGPGRNNILEDYYKARNIHNIMERLGCSVERAIEKFMANDPRFQRQAADGRIDNLKRIYYNHIKAVRVNTEITREQQDGLENKC